MSGPADPSAVPGPEAPPQPPAPVPSADLLSPKALEAQLRWAIYQAGVGMAGSEDPREAQEWADAILKVSQSVVILDPALVAPSGVPPDALHPPRPHPPTGQQPGAQGNEGVAA